MPKATRPASAAKKAAPPARRVSAAAKPAATARPSAAPERGSGLGAAPAKAKGPRAAAAAPAAKGRRAAPAPAPAPADKLLADQHAHLLAERETYVRHAESLKAEAEQLAEEMEPGDIQFDEESGEGATINIERERDLALSAQARGAVEEIDRALARIKAGTYGICERCGEPIPKARLKALPYAALCVACKSGGLSRR